MAGVAALVGTLLPTLVWAPPGAATSSRVKTASNPVSRAYFAHLRIRLVTDSDWASVQLSPGTILRARLSAPAGSHAWRVGGHGFGVAGGPGAGRQQATLDVLYTNFDRRAPVRIQLTKGDIGAARVTAWRVSGDDAVRIGRLRDALHATPHRSTFERQLTLSRQSAMGLRSTALPSVDPRRLVLAFYYPWYAGYRSPALADRPRDARSTDTARGVASLTRQAKRAGVNGFVVSWHGSASDGHHFRLALEAARRYHQLVTGYLETPAAMSTESVARRLVFPGEQVLSWLVQLLDYSRNRAFLHSHGVPVVFVYQMSALSPAGWRQALHLLRVRYHRRVHLVGDSTDPAYLPFEWGVHRYAATEPAGQLTRVAVDASLLAKGGAVLDGARPRLYAATVSPGFDDRRVPGRHDRVVSRRHGARYRETWRAARAARADWVLVTSWNEWYEDTEIEPGRLTGARALRQTRHFTRQWERKSAPGAG